MQRMTRCIEVMSAETHDLVTLFWRLSVQKVSARREAHEMAQNDSEEMVRATLCSQLAHLLWKQDLIDLTSPSSTPGPDALAAPAATASAAIDVDDSDDLLFDEAPPTHKPLRKAKPAPPRAPRPAVAAEAKRASWEIKLSTFSDSASAAPAATAPAAASEASGSGLASSAAAAAEQPTKRLATPRQVWSGLTGDGYEIEGKVLQKKQRAFPGKLSLLAVSGAPTDEKLPELPAQLLATGVRNRFSRFRAHAGRDCVAGKTRPEEVFKFLTATKG